MKANPSTRVRSSRLVLPRPSNSEQPSAAESGGVGVGGFERLLRGNIVGIIDAYGAVHSEFTGEKIAHHEEYWPQQTHNRWRWNHRESIYWLVAERRPSEEGIDAVMRHLTKKYGLQWWDNGHHDIDHLLAKAGRSGIREGWGGGSENAGSGKKRQNDEICERRGKERGS